MPLRELNLEAAIGFSGGVQNGMVSTTIMGEDYIVYPLGASVVIRNIETKAQSFLQGHANTISCLAVSPDGRTCATGEKGAPAKAPIILWDLEAAVRNGNTSNKDGEKICELALVNKEVRSLAFSHDGLYLASGGGQDDNTLVIWNVMAAMNGGPSVNQQDVSCCGLRLSTSGTVITVQWFNDNYENKSTYRVVAAGGTFIKTYEFDASQNKFYEFGGDKCVNATGLGNRSYLSLALTPDDTTLLAGTRSGEVCVFRYSGNGLACCFKYAISDGGPGTEFAGGVRQIEVVPPTEEWASYGIDYALLVGGGGGKLRLMKLAERGHKRAAGFEAQLMGGAKSITPQTSQPGVYWVGTDTGNMYKVDIVNDLDPSSDMNPQFNPILMSTAHCGPGNDSAIRAVCFPKNCPDLILTAGKDIRIWNVNIRAELLRIEVKGVIGGCHCIDLSDDGTLILSGWADGKIRAFLPESGKLAFCVDEAHREECTAVKCYKNIDLRQTHKFRFLSGGADHNLRVWEASMSMYGTVERVKMVYSMKEHRKTITDITISNGNENCISSSVDGSCISWFLEGNNGGKRDGAIFANTEFCAIQYYPDMSQFLTVGTDRKVSYWDSAPSEKTAIREIQASDEGILGGPLRALDIDTDGDIFGTGGDDKLVKVWTYDEGNLEAVGIGHSQSVLGLKIAPGSKTMISVGSEGAIMIWTL